MPNSTQQTTTTDLWIRVWMARILVCVCFSLLLARFAYVQYIQHEHWQALSEGNRVSLIPTPPGRGAILDRNGVVLAHNKSVYTLEITPNQIKNQDIESLIAELQTVLPIGVKDLKRFEKLRKEYKSLGSIPIRSHLSDEEVARFSVQRHRFPGVDVHARLYREYPFGKTASHLLGYIGRINEKDENNLKENNQWDLYRGTDHIGKSGVEQSYETELHGTTGYQRLEVDNKGRPVRVLGETLPQAGQQLTLSIDIELQKVAEEAFAGRRGALVAIDPQNGEVLAFVSQPSFDPNLFVDGIDSESWSMLNEDTARPLNNRALRGLYPPGSTFKPFMALAALTHGARKPGDITYDGGSFRLPGSKTVFRGHATGGVDMRKSIALSSNIYYYKLAWDMGIDVLAPFMKQFGFGQLTGIDLPNEARGILPSKEWKKQRFASSPPSMQRWAAVDVVNFGIGQGYSSYTPLQVANATAILANGGTVFRPHVVRSIRDSQTNKETFVAQAPLGKIPLRPADVEVVKQGLQGTIQYGTARAVAHGLTYTMAGKTGTAQAFSLRGAKYNKNAVSENKRDHAWFMAFAPVDKPKIAIAVLVENGGFGAASAAPITRTVFDAFLRKKAQNLDVASAASQAEAGGARAQ